MEILNVSQGSNAWLQVRKAHFTASEAPAALGKSKYVARTELLHQKATGFTEEVDGFTQALFDRGHKAEAKARPFAELLIAADLYPVTGRKEVEGIALLASLDGLTMDGEIIWEHKLYSEELAAAVRAGTLDPHYTIQMDQQLLVSGAKKCLFMTSDGTEEKMACCWYEASPEKFAALLSGWTQFKADLAEYKPQAPVTEVIGRAPEELPALRIEITGAVTASNLVQFKEHALTVIQNINRDLQTDVDFANAEKTTKWLNDVEGRLAAAKQHALSQTETIDALFRAIDEIAAGARATRLELDKLVKARKEQIRTEILNEGVVALRDHIKALDERLGNRYMPTVPADFAGAMKGKKTVASLRDAVSTTLANAKIEANAIADRIQINLNAFKEIAAEQGFLFPDLAMLVLKAPDDCQAIAAARIAEHNAKEAQRQAAERERIAAEERQKAERELRAQQAATMPSVAPAEPSVAVLASAVVPLHQQAPSLRLGQISERLGFTVTADFLTSLGFPPAATDKSAKLYHEADFPRICATIAQHAIAVGQRFTAQLAA